MSRPMTIAEASRLFLAIHGDLEAQRTTYISELDDLIEANTFEEFVRKNDLTLYEEVVR